MDTSTFNGFDTTTPSPPDASNDPDVDVFGFVTYGVLLNVVVLLGIFGNVFSIIILSQPQMRSSINYLLIGLACSDTVLVITSSLMYGLAPIYRYSGYMSVYFHEVLPRIVPYIFPITWTAQTITVYLTLMVSVERYIAVCHPLRSRSICTTGRAKNCVRIIVAFSLLYNLPRFWEYTYNAYDISLYNRTSYYVSATTLRTDYYYATVYVRWLYYVLMYLLPFTLLLILNACIFKEVRRANVRRQSLSSQQRHEIGLATVLLWIVVVFFMCNVLALLVYMTDTWANRIAIHANNLLFTINSSVNFIIYIVFCEKFRRLFLCVFNGSSDRAAQLEGRTSSEQTDV